MKRILVIFSILALVTLACSLTGQPPTQPVQSQSETSHNVVKILKSTVL